MTVTTTNKEKGHSMYNEKEPTWKIKPKKYKTFRGEAVYGLEGTKESAGGTLWAVSYATKKDVELEEEINGNRDGLKVGDFTGYEAGDVWNAENIEYAVDEAELEVAAILADAELEFGA
jgi:hypothetical protein